MYVENVAQHDLTTQPTGKDGWTIPDVGIAENSRGKSTLHGRQHTAMFVVAVEGTGQKTGRRRAGWVLGLIQDAPHAMPNRGLVSPKEFRVGIPKQPLVQALQVGGRGE